MVERAKPATIYDVAKRAGVSHQSVSRVLREVPGIREDTVERVRKALVELDYRPSVVARELANSKRARLGVVGYESFEASTAKVLKGIDQVARREGFTLEIVSVDPLGDVDGIARRIETINAMDVAGLLATSPTQPVREALERSVFRMPVHLDQRTEEDEAGRSRAAALVLGHLLDLGHRRIAHVAGPQAWDSARHRRDAWAGALAEHGVPPQPEEAGDWTARSGYEAGLRLDLEGVTAVFVANDRMALGLLRALAERGVRVPQDVSVVGIDDIPEAEYFQPPLTTVHIDFEGAGRAAAEALIRQIREPEAGPSEQAERRLEVRASSAAPPR